MLQPSLAARAAVPAFIIVWASGYIVAKLAARDAEPLSFLVIRYIGVVILMVVACVVALIKSSDSVPNHTSVPSANPAASAPRQRHRANAHRERAN